MVCGIQHSQDGEIEWSKNMPKTCLLSPALQHLVTPLLAGLMECDSQRMWSFEKFFNGVTHILSHRIYHIFFVNHMKEMIFYLNPNDRYFHISVLNSRFVLITLKSSINDFRLKLESSTGVTVSSQLLLWNKQEIFELSEVNTTDETPIILLNSHSTKMKSSPIMSSNPPKFPDLQTTVTNCDQDAQLAKLCSSMAYSVQRIINKCVLYHRLANNTPQHVM